jgi:phosphoribosylformylglycinamidine cyclo-ligase
MLTYRAAGVNVAKADHLLNGLKGLIRSTHRGGVLRDLGQFGGLFRLPAGLREPVLVSSTDGAGTKITLAQQAGRHRGIGIDVVAMNVNDVLVYGARPLFFLDYIAMGRLDGPIYRQLLAGVVDGCRQSGCALLGGETAEMPGVYAPSEYDIAGFVVGVVERKRLIDGSQVRVGDTVIGLASSGVHANGFSLVRKAFAPVELSRLSRQLLAPTRIYVEPVLRLLGRARVHALAHVTGGGLARRLPSLVSRQPGLAADWSPGSWPVPPIFRRIQQAGGISDEEMYRTFNMGLGMVMACPAADAAAVLASMKAQGLRAWTVGRIARRSGAERSSE